MRQSFSRWLAVAIPLIAVAFAGVSVARDANRFPRRVPPQEAVRESLATSLVHHNLNGQRGRGNVQHTLDAVQKPLSSIALKVTPPQKLIPPDVAGQSFRTVPKQGYPWTSRGESLLSFHWAPSGLVHQPLYFEDAALERYGQTHSHLLQPVVSSAHFFGSVVILPYKMGLDLPHRRIYTLGYHRPGSYAPSEKNRLPWSWRGAVFQAGAVVGGLSMFP